MGFFAVALRPLFRYNSAAPQALLQTAVTSDALWTPVWCRSSGDSACGGTSYADRTGSPGMRPACGPAARAGMARQRLRSRCHGLGPALVASGRPGLVARRQVFIV